MGDIAKGVPVHNRHPPYNGVAPIAFRRDAIGLSITIGLVLLIYLASFWGIFFSGDIQRLAGLGDFHTLNSPKGYFLDLRLQEGEFPLWDPLTLTGTPYAAHPLAMAFYPPNLVRALIARPATPVDFLYSLYLFVLFHMLVAASGLYLLARREGISVAAAIVIAVAVPFSERWVLNGLTQLPMLCTVAWMPIVLLCLRQAAFSAETRRRAAWAILAGVVYGFQILGGWPQVAIYTTVLYVIFYILRITGTEFPRPFSLRGVGRLLASIVWPGLLFGLVGALIGLALILPASELIALSGRSRENISRFSEIGAMINFSSAYAFALARAEFGMGPMAYVYSIAEGGDVWFSLNLGLLAVAMASPLFLFLFRFRLFVYLLLTYFAFDLTFGPPMPVAVFFENFAPFALSTPSYNSVIIVVPLALVAGFALDGLLLWAKSGPLPRPAAAILCALGAPVFALAAEPPDHQDQRSLAWSLLPMGILLLIVFGRGLRHWPRLVVAALIVESALCAVLIVDRSVARRVWMLFPFSGDTEIFRQPPDPELRRARVTCWPCNHNVWALESTINGYDPLALYATFDTLANPGEESTYERGPSTEKNLRAAALLKRSFWLAPAFVRGLPPDKDRLFPPTSAVFIDTAESLALPELKLDDLPLSTVATPTAEIELWKHDPEEAHPTAPRKQSLTVPGVHLPRRNHALRIYYQSPVPATVTAGIYGAANAVQFYRVGPIPLPPTGETEGLLELPLPDFESAEISISVESEGELRPNTVSRLALIEDEADEIDRLTVKKSSANEVVISLQDLPGPRALVFTEMNYPGWGATLDGTAVPVLRAYGTYQAVVVPPGSHEVKFRFRPWRVFVGASISLSTLLAALSAVAVLFTRRKPS